MPRDVQPSQSASESEPIHNHLACEVRVARRLLLAAAKGKAWPCPHCGAERRHEDGWWSASDLREAAGIDGPVAMIATLNMISDGELETDSRLRVRLAP